MDKKNAYIQSLSAKLTARHIDRRQFMNGALATGMAVATATALADTAIAATPKKGGHITSGHGHGATSDTLDPGLFENGFQNALGHNVHNRLTGVGPDGNLAPEIAESWEASADASTWRFKIRDAEFHNGKKVTVNDVIASINHHRGEDSTSAAKPLMASITDMKDEGNNTVAINLDSGNADFPFVLTDYHMSILPANSDGTIDWQSGVGCGSYKLDHYDAGVSAEMSRNGNYWTDSVGHFDSVQMLSLIDPNARTSALVSGTVDVIDKVDLKTAGLLSRKPGVNVRSATGTQHYTFPMRCDTAPFDNVDLRRAIKHGVNREELLEKILFGYGELGNDHPIGSGQRFYNSEMPQTPYDPDKAKFFLKRSGLGNVKIDLSAADAAFAGAVDAAVLIQNTLAPIGIDVNVVREPNDGYWGDVWLNKPWCACYWGGRPVEDMMFSTAYQSGASWNDSFWSNERFDKLLVEARAELDNAKRREMYFEMQSIVNDEGGVLVPFFAAYVFATSDNVVVPDQIASNWDLDGSRFIERWWKA